MAANGSGGRYGLRRRRETNITSSLQLAAAEGLQKLLVAAAATKHLIVFSGSGLSASSGMSTFSTKGGLYERAQKRYSVPDGKKLFTYSFFEKQRLEALAFFADIYLEALAAVPAAGHDALAGCATAGKLLRHYTLNIDGLHTAVGLSTWHHESNTAGLTVEMHGSIRQLVCPECGACTVMTPALHRMLHAQTPIPCTACAEAALRFRVMLYDDAEGDVITPDDVFDALEADLKLADMVLWAGISFEQSASTSYFRKVRHMLAENGRLAEVTQAIINPSDEALWNLMSSCSNTGDLDVLEVLLPSDEVLPQLAAVLGVGTPQAEALAAAAAAAAITTAAADSASAASSDSESVAARRGRRKPRCRRAQSSPQLALAAALGASSSPGLVPGLSCDLNPNLNPGPSFKPSAPLITGRVIPSSSAGSGIPAGAPVSVTGPITAAIAMSWAKDSRNGAPEEQHAKRQRHGEAGKLPRSTVACVDAAAALDNGCVAPGWPLHQQPDRSLAATAVYAANGNRGVPPTLPPQQQQQQQQQQHQHQQQEHSHKGRLAALLPHLCRQPQQQLSAQLLAQLHDTLQSQRQVMPSQQPCAVHQQLGQSEAASTLQGQQQQQQQQQQPQQQPQQQQPPMGAVPPLSAQQHALPPNQGQQGLPTQSLGAMPQQLAARHQIAQLGSAPPPPAQQLQPPGDAPQCLPAQQQQLAQLGSAIPLPQQHCMPVGAPLLPVEQLAQLRTLNLPQPQPHLQMESGQQSSSELGPPLQQPQIMPSAADLVQRQPPEQLPAPGQGPLQHAPHSSEPCPGATHCTLATTDVCSSATVTHACAMDELPTAVAVAVSTAKSTGASSHQDLAEQGAGDPSSAAAAAAAAAVQPGRIYGAESALAVVSPAAAAAPAAMPPSAVARPGGVQLLSPTAAGSSGSPRPSQPPPLTTAYEVLTEEGLAMPAGGQLAGQGDEPMVSVSQSPADSQRAGQDHQFMTRAESLEAKLHAAAAQRQPRTVRPRRPRTPEIADAAPGDEQVSAGASLPDEAARSAVMT